MSPVAAPVSFPNPTSCNFTSPEVRAISPSGNKQARRRNFDDILIYELGYELSFAQSTVFDAWYETALLRGSRAAVLRLPGPGGVIPRELRFTSGIKRDLILSIGYAISFTAETL